MNKKEKQFFFRQSTTVGDEACEISGGKKNKNKKSDVRLCFNIET